MPAEKSSRDAIRHAAEEFVGRLDPLHPPVWDDLEAQGKHLLASLSFSDTYLGFAMVSINNAFWQRPFAAVPFSRRLLLLPKCLSHSTACAGYYDTVGLHCQGCGACHIQALTTRAEALGYQVLVAEGTSSVLLKILDGEADALLGVACLDSLEKSFSQVSGLGIPNVAVPLLTDGCTDTEAELDAVLAYLTAHGEQSDIQPYTCMPLLRETAHCFSEPQLSALLAPYVHCDNTGSLLHATDAIALDWLQHGGKRLRPFITVAAYAVARHGIGVLSPNAEIDELIPVEIRRIALAIEALHKASLVHDDIEDDDAFRYGRETLHRVYGIPPAMNVGDFLVGLGYRLIAGQQEALGTQPIGDILAILANAHLELCRGQGAELLWQRQGGVLHAQDVLAIYALKTAPAFEVAIYAGLRAADCPIDRPRLTQVATYLGEGYQLLNDLTDWQSDDANKVTAGLDVLAARPTLLWAFAQEAGAGARLAELMSARKETEPALIVSEIRRVYTDAGVFAKADRLLATLRRRATEGAEQFAHPAVQELMRFLIRIILQRAPSAQ